MKNLLVWLVYSALIILLMALPRNISRIILLIVIFGIIVFIIYAVIQGDGANHRINSKPFKKRVGSKETRRIKTLYLENEVINLTDKMPWGKYKGHLVSTLPSSYFNWLVSKAIDITYYKENEPYVSKNPNDRHFGKSYTYDGKPIRMIEDED